MKKCFRLLHRSPCFWYNKPFCDRSSTGNSMTDKNVLHLYILSTELSFDTHPNFSVVYFQVERRNDLADVLCFE